VGSSEEDRSEAAELARLYRRRFTDTHLAFKERMWEVLCQQIFQRYVGAADTVLDLGAGRCEFINAIHCKEKIAVDLNPDVTIHARDARVVHAPGSDMAPVTTGSVEVVFSSNFFEHLPDKSSVLETLRECHRVLRTRGRLIVLQPNIRYLAGRYWDYFDHYTPLTHHSMVEALELTGFQADQVIPRFLPYTVKDTRLPMSISLLRIYLRLPLVWPVFGRQMLIVAHRT
jgi:SAM-dependent methyltransferase